MNVMLFARFAMRDDRAIMLQNVIATDSRCVSVVFVAPMAGAHHAHYSVLTFQLKVDDDLVFLRSSYSPHATWPRRVAWNRKTLALRVKRSDMRMQN